MASVLQQPEAGTDEGHVSEDARRQNEKVRTERERQKQVLNLKRQRERDSPPTNAFRRATRARRNAFHGRHAPA